MDIEKLTQSQIVLLTILVSFVTSIATGIVTVSLMGQAPPSIAQTVNRIVERTVEKVAPNSGQAAASVVTTEKTVIVKESDLIAKAIESISPSVVRLYAATKDEQGKDTELFLGLGVVIDGNGVIATDAAALPSTGTILVGLSAGARVTATVRSSDLTSGLALLQAATSSEDNKSLDWKAAPIAGTKPVLGETVVGISGKAATHIADGIITALPDSADATSSPKMIETNLAEATITFGSPIINVDGEVVGISTSGSRSAAAGTFLSSLSILSYNSKPADTKSDKPS